jgi:signal transduction histidine kinase
MTAAIPTFGSLADAAQHLGDSLGNIRLIADLLLSEDHALPAPMRREYLGALAEKAARLQGVAEDMTTLVRIHNHEVSIENVSLRASEIVQQAIEACSAAASRKRVPIHSSVSDGEPLVSGDYWKLSKAIGGVMSYIVRSTPPGGSVAVDVDHTADGIVQIVFRRLGTMAAPEPAVQFFPGDAETSSEALGLTLSSQILAMHGGSLQTRETATGHTVTVRLPGAADRG